MSGGSMNYAYSGLQNDAVFKHDISDGLTPRQAKYRLTFRKVLDDVIKALHDIEWVDSGDYSPDGELDAIHRVLLTAVEQLSTRELQEIVAKRLRDAAAPVVEEKRTMKPLSVSKPHPHDHLQNQKPYECDDFSLL